MIDSQTELPSHERGPTKVLAKGRQAVASAARQVQDWARTLPWDRLADRIRSSGQILDNLEEAPLRVHLSRLGRWATASANDGPLLNRYALHLVVVFLALGVVTISQVTLPEIDFLIPTPTPGPDRGVSTVSVQPSNRGANRLVSNDTGLFPVPVPHTIIAERDRMEVITYTVQPNDNLWVIATGFGVQVETIMWANPEVEKAPDLLAVGETLIILPVDGIYHTVRAGDTVEKLAKEFKTTAEEIVGFEANELAEPYALTPGQRLVIPGGRKKIVPLNIYPMTWVGSPPEGSATGSGRFAWPARGTLTQGFWSAHLAIDIGNRTGTPVYAADAGYVRLAGQDTWGYGNQIVIDHGNGYLTRYAHLHTILVKAGQSVEKNQQIGTMGNTGRSTGPHLHFEVIQGNVKRNPLGYLP
jgi:LysM repeat protein